MSVVKASHFGRSVKALCFSTLTSTTSTERLRFALGLGSSGESVTALWYMINQHFLTVTRESCPPDAPHGLSDAAWDEMLRCSLEIFGDMKFKDHGVAEAPPPGDARDRWSAKREARVEQLLAEMAERYKRREYTEFIYRIEEITGPIEITLLAPKVI
ncbi:hypothetical protein HUS91_31255 [Pseudomonas chlororaphis]|uniref:hypothetical protein n=1 Tax=Pseudomonas chlororaphis TaxID=587753 RepID=UPI000F55B36C|nr:hypothetical protein [Pseudomonas chlororaphis]MBP5089954.1 hypothetical protein [Pseudomonas chlororaphis]